MEKSEHYENKSNPSNTGEFISDIIKSQFIKYKATNVAQIIIQPAAYGFKKFYLKIIYFSFKSFIN